ncbi:unnamed protein product [Pleuronectes platessa]|uniref:Uncharacterized protein n=1 Tax=Pleuronectes platessa TaxID=8262 RepID=A0A9N7VIE8_PLEPL|nr:unnamed protein product [Pleuronectes platessa]
MTNERTARGGIYPLTPLHRKSVVWENDSKDGDRSTAPANMSTVEGAGQDDEGDYGRASKRLKTEEREEGEDELEEGEDSDSGSLPGNADSVVETRARWSCIEYGAGRRVRSLTIESGDALTHSITDAAVYCYCHYVAERAISSLSRIARE